MIIGARKCETCGRELETRHGERGRPALYCGGICRNWAKRLRELIKLVDLISFTLKAAHEARADIWLLGNDCRPRIDVMARRAFAGELVRFRREHGLSQRQLSTITGIPQWRLSHFETCLRPANDDERCRLLSALGGAQS